MTDFQDQDQDYDSDHKETGPLLQQLNKDNTRLRNLRDIYRGKYNEILTANAELQETVQELEKRIQDMTVNDGFQPVQEEQYLDSDAEDQPVGRVPIKRSSSSPVTSMKLAVISGNNKKYPDVPYFYGDPREWEPWKLHLDSKFRASAMLFPAEQDKIDYIRDHCKSTAFDIIKAGFTGGVRFKTSDEIIELLDSNFGAFDPVGDAEATVHDPDFVMKEGEKFDTFLARFSSTIAPLQYSEFMKISTLKRTITFKLRDRVTDGHNSKVFKDFVQRLRLVDAQMRQYGWYTNPPNGIDENNDNDDEVHEVPGPLTRETYPTDFQAELKKDGRCFRCLLTGHRPGPSAVCKDDPQLSYPQAKRLLAKLRPVELD